MARRETATLPQPPWVWGPSEVDEWLRLSSTSKPRKGGHREGSEIVARLGVEVVGARGPVLMEALGEACADAGVRAVTSLPRSPTEAPRHVAIVSLRSSLLGRGVRVDLRFEPPIHPSTAARIVERLKRRFEVTRLSMKEARVRLPPRRR